MMFVLCRGVRVFDPPRLLSPRSLLCALVALAAAGLSACKPGAPQFSFQRPPAPVTVTTAFTRDVPIYLDEIGKTVAAELVTIQPQVSGQIMARQFTDGAELKAGDPLFTIDTRPYQAKVAEAEANLEQSRAMLELTQAEYSRTEKAFKVNAASREDLDTKKGALDTAAAHVKVSQASLDTAKLNLSFCTINSPIAGRAGARMVDVGNIVTGNTTSLLSIQRIAPIYVDFTITERDLPSVRTRMAAGALQARISLPDTPDDFRTGELTFLDNSVQEGAGRIRLRVTLPNTDRYFWPGQFVNVRLVLETISQAVLVPFGSAQTSQQGPYVYVLTNDDIAEIRPVTLGQRQGSLIVIRKGVTAGERIVVTGQLSVTPGGKVRVVDASGASATAPATAAAPEASTAPATRNAEAAH
jgi:membrane fusion protein, multidrug efflux system